MDQGSEIKQSKESFESERRYKEAIRGFSRTYHCSAEKPLIAFYQTFRSKTFFFQAPL